MPTGQYIEGVETNCTNTNPGDTTMTNNNTTTARRTEIIRTQWSQANMPYVLGTVNGRAIYRADKDTNASKADAVFVIYRLSGKGDYCSRNIVEAEACAFGYAAAVEYLTRALRPEATPEPE